MTIYKWINLYPMAQAQGFVYFKAYLNVPTSQVVGWITRYGYNLPYAYNVYWVDNEGNITSDTRGTWQHADYAVQGGVQSLQGDGIPIMAQEGNKVRNSEIFLRLKATMDGMKLGINKIRS